MKGKYYIQGMAAISPQHTFDGDLFTAPLLITDTNLLSCKEPDYKPFIPANSLRRMSRVLKMGLAASLQCLQRSHSGVPGAIVTGTGKGSLQDTERFLKEIDTYKETALNPTPFIQSTYNSLNGLIALQQQSTTYNNTYVHRGFSFESALLDSMMLLEEGRENVLTGAFEEITPEHFIIKSKAGFWKDVRTSNVDLYKLSTPGSIAGEGAVFFVLDKVRKDHSVAAITGLRQLYKPSAEKPAATVTAFLTKHGLTAADIDVLITGRNGDSRYDHYYDSVAAQLDVPELPFKHLCGEHDTAAAFGTWLGAMLLQQGKVPSQWFPMVKALPEQPQRVLLYNHFYGAQHVLLLLEKA